MKVPNIISEQSLKQKSFSASCPSLAFLALRAKSNPLHTAYKALQDVNCLLCLPEGQLLSPKFHPPSILATSQQPSYALIIPA